MFESQFILDTSVKVPNSDVYESFDGDFNIETVLRSFITLTIFINEGLKGRLRLFFAFNFHCVD